MPITLKVQAEPDTGSFKSVADQAVKTFATAGKDASASFSKQFGDAAKDVAKAVARATDAYDAVAAATGKANTAEKQRQQYLQKSEDLAKQAEAAEKKLSDARASDDTKAASAAEKELQRVRDQMARTDTQIVRSAEAVSSSRRREAREIRDAIASYRDLEAAKRRADSPGFGRSFDSYTRGQGVMSGALSQSSGMIGQFQSLGGSSGKAFVGGAVAAIVAGSFIQAGAKAAGMVVDGFKSVMDTGLNFSKAVNEFQGVTGASAAQTSQMAAAARALGSDITMPGVDATGSAQAMTELTKAGFTANESIDSLRGTMQLATAAGIDGAAAAEIQANAMNAFGLSADQAASVADVLANAEVGSSAGITDIAQALQQVSGISRGFGEDIHGTTAALMMLADAGIKGSDAGTLLKSTLQSITDGSNPAQDAIKSLGLSLYDFDTGQFVGFRELFRQLDEAKKRMSPQQFQSDTNTLFGSDAMRAPMLGSIDAFDKALAKTYEIGTAADMAKAKMQGWPGVVEGINNAVGEIKLSLFEGLFDTPAGRDLGKGIVTSLEGLVEWVNTHKPEIVSFVSDFVSAMATGADAILTYVARITEAGSVMQDMLSHSAGVVIEGIAKVAGGIGTVIKHLPGMGEIGSNLEGAATAVDNVMDKWQSVGAGMRTTAGVIDSTREGIRGFRDTLTGSLADVIAAEDSNRQWQSSFKDLSDSIEAVPGTKDFVIKDNSPELIAKLEALGIAVQQLPDGRQVIHLEYRDSSGNPLSPDQVSRMLGYNSQSFASAGDAQRARRGLPYNAAGQGPAIAPPAPPTAGGGPAWSPGSGSRGSRDGLPDAPVLPISYTNTAGMSPEMANAQNRVDETAHDLAEKQARLTQLEASNVASADDVQKARNDVAKAQQDADIAQRRMQEAQINAYGKSTKQLNGMASELSDLGASLDSDFGISKGLGGIIENAVKALGNALAAPFLQALGMVEKANPNEGSGLVGILAANGAFGQQYTPGFAASYSNYAASAMGPTALQPGFTPTMLRDTGSVPSGPQSKLAAALIEQYFGSQLRGTIGGSRDNNTAKNTHDAGLSIDIPIGPDQMALGDQINAWLQQNAGALGLEYSIWRDQGKYPGGGGFTAGGHQNHIDAHFNGDVTSASGALTNFAGAVTQATGAVTAQTSLWDKVAQAESSGNWGNQDTGNNGHYGGLQFSPETWRDYGGIDLTGQSNPANASREDQIAIANRTAFTGYNGVAPQGLGAWETIANGSVPGVGVNTPASAFGAGAPLTGVPMMPGGPLAGGMPTAAPFGGPTSFAQSTPAVGLGNPYPSQGGNSGNAIGGLALDGLMGAAGAADLFMPGAGAAAKIGIQLANRTIGYGAQNLGIGASGLMEAVSIGDNPMGGLGAGWLGKIAGGLAGAAPALPNMAGMKPPPGSPTGGTEGQKAGNTYGDTNINVTAPQNADGNKFGKEIAAHQYAMQAPAGSQG